LQETSTWLPQAVPFSPMVEEEEAKSRTHRPGDGSYESALQSHVRMYLCSFPAAGLRSLEQPAVVVVQQRKSLEQSDKRLSSHVASVRLQLLIYGERSRSSLHQPTDLNRKQEPEKSRSLDCQVSSCWSSDDL
jgi:hypothetical protein